MTIDMFDWEEKSNFIRTNIKFDLEKLREATLEAKLKYPNTKISLTQIPNDKLSYKGDNLTGSYWIESSYGVVEQRSGNINEEAYTEVIEEFKDTYWEEIITKLKERYLLGRVRILSLQPRNCLSYHRDPEPRLHIPIFTNPGALMIIDNEVKHLPADGHVWYTDTTKYHNVANGGETQRIHLVATVLKTQ